MIQLTDINGKRHFLAPNSIAQVTEAGTSSAWHGIRSYIKLFDGSVLEVREVVERIVNAIHNEHAKDPTP